MSLQDRNPKSDRLDNLANRIADINDELKRINAELKKYDGVGLRSMSAPERNRITATITHLQIRESTLLRAKQALQREYRLISNENIRSDMRNIDPHVKFMTGLGKKKVKKAQT